MLKAYDDHTELSVHHARLRRLALRCCHDLAAVAADLSELRAFEYRGVVPGRARPRFCCARLTSAARSLLARRSSASSSRSPAWSACTSRPPASGEIGAYLPTRGRKGAAEEI
ncbi:hypothetical protein C2845_PM13G05280 [Panicum miliaceum]|uniref:Uncharacterized protein n=1 Tax=Panicum miliaceum TaxID=4540 RepID=A0A3L6RIB9_PANMI|nr:hypothetical protein C2845_PM13G05280 [Panicum miliaceum]